MKKENNRKQNNRLYSILAIATALLVLPLLAMCFTNEVKWGVFDFVIAALLLYGVSFSIEFIMRTTKKWQYKIIALFIILLLFVLTWIELAVGVFGTPLAGN